MVHAPVGVSDLLIFLTGELCLSSDDRKKGGPRDKGGGGQVVISADRAYFLSTVSGR